MKIVELEQGTPEWLEWRATRWMASEAPVVMGCAPSWAHVRTWDELREAKAGLGPEPDEHTRKMWARGHELEDFARREWCRLNGMRANPACVESDSRPPFAASLDGLADNGAGWIEIKCPTGQAKWWQEIESWGDIPEHYRWQVFHQWVAMDCPMDTLCDFVVLPPDLDLRQWTRRFHAPDLPFVDDLAAKWGKWQYGAQPGRDDNEWNWWAQQWRQCKREADRAAGPLAEARAKLIELAGPDGASGCGVTVRKSERKGAISTAAMAADGIDIEKYRGEPSESWSVRADK